MHQGRKYLTGGGGQAAEMVGSSNPALQSPLLWLHLCKWLCMKPRYHPTQSDSGVLLVEKCSCFHSK